MKCFLSVVSVISVFSVAKLSPSWRSWRFCNRTSEGAWLMPFTKAQHAFLDRPQSAIVATHRRDGTAVQSVVWYVRDGDTLWFSCAPASTKARHLRRDPRVSVL